MFQFDNVYCISLDRHPDRWARFKAKLPCDWPFRMPERFAATDGRCVPVPGWWTAGAGAWGCYQSHLNILMHCIKHGIESVLILEDDAVCCDGFAVGAIQYLQSLPDDWELVYFGGQHLSWKLHPPVRVNPNVFIPYNVNRTHAYAVRGLSAMRRIVWHLQDLDRWQSGHHIDHHMGTLVKQRQFPVYCPSRWLIGQDDGLSSIAGKHCQRRFFESEFEQEIFLTDVVLITIPDVARANEMALWLKNRGVFMGNRFVQQTNQRAATPLSPTDTGQSMELAQILGRYYSTSGAELAMWEGSLRCELAAWLRYMTFAAKQRKTVAGGYAPRLTNLVPLLQSLLGERLKLIDQDVFPQFDRILGKTARRLETSTTAKN